MYTFICSYYLQILKKLLYSNNLMFKILLPVKVCYRIYLIDQYEFSIFNVNIRSSRTNFDFFRHYTNELKHQFSVYTLTETWLKNYNKNNLKGYQHIHKLRDNKLGGGVSIYVKDNILYEEKKDLYIDLKGVDSLSIEIPKKEFNIYISHAYYYLAATFMYLVDISKIILEYILIVHKITLDFDQHIGVHH